jgi:hypothetical protein
MCALMQRTLLACGLLILLAGCNQHPTRYAWGSYEQLIYVSYAAPGKVPTESQIARLEDDQLKAAAKNKPMPPGWHAHLGYLYAQTGRIDLAEQQLLVEKQAFPESTVFVDRLLANLKQTQQAPQQPAQPTQSTGQAQAQ